MSHQNNSDPSWEETQRRLVRSLFANNPPPLSPVAEEEESSDSPSTLEQPPSAQARESSERSYSPLPPLTIEIVPTKNKHDEPEEFYVRLEQRMRRAYRRLFVENRSDVGDLSDDSSVDISGFKYSKRRESFGEPYTVDDSLQTEEIDEVNESETREEHATLTNDEKGSSSTDILPKSTTDDLQAGDTNGDMSCFYTSSETDEEAEEYEEEEEKEKDEEDKEKEEDLTSELENSESSTESPHASFRKITFRADFHKDAQERIAQENVRVQTHRNNLSDEIDNSAELEENDVSDPNISSEGDNESVLSNVEVMRSARVGTSGDSLQPLEDSHRNETTARERSTSLGAVKQSTSNVMEYEESFDSEVLLTSIADNENRNETAALNTRKRKSTTPLRHSSPKMKCVGTQIDANESNRLILDQNIFVGVPRIIRLL